MAVTRDADTLIFTVELALERGEPSLLSAAL
jgi:hypothetical protein